MATWRTALQRTMSIALLLTICCQPGRAEEWRSCSARNCITVKDGSPGQKYIKKMKFNINKISGLKYKITWELEYKMGPDNWITMPGMKFSFNSITDTLSSESCGTSIDLAHSTQVEVEFIDDEIEDVLHSTTSVMELSNTELSSTSVLDCNSEQTNTAILNARETSCCQRVPLLPALDFRGVDLDSKCSRLGGRFGPACAPTDDQMSFYYTIDRAILLTNVYQLRFSLYSSDAFQKMYGIKIDENGELSPTNQCRRFALQPLPACNGTCRVTFNATSADSVVTIRVEGAEFTCNPLCDAAPCSMAQYSVVVKVLLRGVAENLQMVEGARCQDIAVPNGLVSTSGTSAAITCNHQFYGVGRAVVSCLSDGSWPPDALSCWPACPSVAEPAHGTALVTNTTATFSCDTHHFLVGTATVSEGTATLACLPSGHWDNPTPSCTPHTCETWSCGELEYCAVVQTLPTCFLSCPAITVPHSSTQRWSTIAILSCDDYYYIAGAPNTASLTMNCLPDGSWDSPDPTCQLHDCSTFVCAATEYCTDQGLPQCFPACPSITVLHASVQHLDSTAVITCEEYCYVAGNTVAESATISCVEGNWNASVVCQLHDCSTWGCSAEEYCGSADGLPVCYPLCPQITAITHGTVDSQTRSSTFSCNEYYYLEGVERLNCLETGSWDQPSPLCRLHDCSTWLCSAQQYCLLVGEVPVCYPLCQEISAIVHGSVASLPRSTTFSCDGYYYLVGPERLNCLPDTPLIASYWDSAAPLCQLHDCGTWSCSEEEYCSIEDNLPACLPACPVISSLDHGSVLSGKRIASFSCSQPYYYMAGSETLLCDDGRWNGSVPTCYLHDCWTWSCEQQEYCSLVDSIPVCLLSCPILPDPSDGRVVSSDTTANFFCDEFFFIVGSVQLTCLASGSWNSSAPTCQQHDCNTWECGQEEDCVVEDGAPACFPACPTIEALPHGTVTPSTRLLSFTCHENYYLVGPQTLSCLSDGQWDDTTPSCELQDCSNISCEEEEYCRTVDSLPVCFPSCPILDSIPRGAVKQWPRFTVYSCKTKFYRLVGQDRRECLADGTWDGTAPSCQRHDCSTWACEQQEYCQIVGSRPVCYQACPDAPSIPEGIPNITDSTLTFSCTAHYYLVGVATLYCSDGSWSGELPTCYPHDCKSWSCAVEEYCTLNDNENNVPVCLPRCPSISDFPNGTVKVKQKKRIALFSCDNFFYIKGPGTVSCSSSGTWADPFPTCHLHDCSTWPCGEAEFCSVVGNVPRCEPRCPTITTLNSAIVATPKLVVFSCNQHYYLEGPATLLCVDGSWNGLVPTCHVIQYDCATWSCSEDEYCSIGDPLPLCFKSCESVSNEDIPDGSVSARDSIAQFSCNEYYFLQGTGTLRCVGGAWNSPLPTCHLHDCTTWSCDGAEFCAIRESRPVCFTSCPALDVELSGGEVEANHTTAVFTCNQDFYLVGSATLHCSEGVWSGPAPTCLPTTCQARGPCSAEHYCKEKHSLALCLPSCPVVSLEHGVVTATDSTASFTCEEGYDLIGVSNSLSCLSGAWDGLPPVCRNRVVLNSAQHLQQCLGTVQTVGGCNDLLDTLKENMPESRDYLTKLVQAARAISFTSPRNAFMVTKILQKEVLLLERHLSEETRSSIGAYVEENAAYLWNVEPGNTRLERMVLVNMRLLGSLLRSLQMQHSAPLERIPARDARELWFDVSRNRAGCGETESSSTHHQLKIVAQHLVAHLARK